jgi:GNAT superfamily N-acetyltransferase
VSDPDPPFVVRRATEKDLPALGRLGAALIRTHYAFDQKRFMAPPRDPESGYAWFLGTQLKEDDVAIFVAERAGTIVGYVYVLVLPEAQRRGIARALLEAACDWFRSIGMPRVILWTAEKNDAAQQLFARAGFRRTMIEMTRELDS